MGANERDGDALVWTEQYNCHTARVGCFTIHVNWSMTKGRHYEVSFNGIHLKNDFASLDDAKVAGVKLARKHLARALAELGNAPVQKQK